MRFKSARHNKRITQSFSESENGNKLGDESPSLESSEQEIQSSPAVESLPTQTQSPEVNEEFKQEHSQTVTEQSKLEFSEESEID